MECIGKHLPDFAKPKKYQHTDERFEEVYKALGDLHDQVAHLKKEIHLLKTKGEIG